MNTRTYLYLTLITGIICFATFNESFAQSGAEGHGDPNAYEIAAGLRGGFGVGLTYKMALGDSKTNYAEAVGFYYNDALVLKALYERTFTTKVDGLRWYLGGGPSIGIGNDFHFGLALAPGLEFTFFDIPINFSVDFMPTFQFLRDDADNLFDLGAGGLSIRYIIRQ